MLPPRLLGFMRRTSANSVDFLTSMFSELSKIYFLLQKKKNEENVKER